MGLLLWLALIVAVLVGMCVGASINREYSRAFQRQAERSQALVHELRAELEAVERQAVAASAERCAAPAPPIVVNLHMPPLQPPRPYSPLPMVIDGQVVHELPAGWS